MESKTSLNWKKRAFSKRKSKLDEKLVNIVDKVLKQIFGETATITIYKYLEEKYSLKREEIPSKPEVFTEGLKMYFDSGASVVAGMILNAGSELGLKKVEDKDFFEHLRELRRVSYK